MAVVPWPLANLTMQLTLRRRRDRLPELRRTVPRYRRASFRTSRRSAHQHTESGRRSWPSSTPPSRCPPQAANTQRASEPGCADCDAVQRSTMQYGAVQCSTVQYGAVRCGAVWCSAVQCKAVNCSTVQRNAACGSAMQCDLAQNRFACLLWQAAFSCCLLLCCSHGASIKRACQQRQCAYGHTYALIHGRTGPPGCIGMKNYISTKAPNH
jgi:hypothetical protein